MSRIAGSIVGHESQQSRELTEKMVSAFWRTGWEKAVADSIGGSFGWTGCGDSELALDGECLVVMDGRIYNRADLAAEPGADVNLVIALFRKHGFRDALRRINGDFAIALYDSRSGALWLGRDRFGLKPLYYVKKPGVIAFASQPGCLLKVPGVSREVHRQFVAVFAGSHYRCFDNVPDASPYAEIAQIPAAHFAKITKDTLSVERYWSLDDAADFDADQQQLAEQYRELLRDAVMRRYKAAQKPAFTLSGGMDSSSVLACAVSGSGHKQVAYSTVYKDKTYDESDEIRSILDATVERWNAVSVGSPDVFAIIEKMIAVHDEPIATATWLSHFLLCEEAAKSGYGSFFGGLGGDEVNAGEYEHFYYFFADLRAAKMEDRLTREVAKWVEYHNHPIFRKSHAFMESELVRLVDFLQPGRCLPDRRRFMRYAGMVNESYFDLNSFVPVMDHPFGSYLKNRTYQDMVRETIPCCLRAEDRQTSAFGMDNYLPFFDHRLVEFMFRVPTALKYKDGVAKNLLREAMKGILPEETRTRIKKTGWNAPAHCWFSGKGLEPLLDLVHSRSFRERGIYNVGKVLEIIEEHERIVSAGEVRENHMMFLWQLVNLELWFRHLEGTV
jgi:asparagine synthase (glutamine-hydrolysing)